MNLLLAGHMETVCAPGAHLAAPLSPLVAEHVEAGMLQLAGTCLSQGESLVQATLGSASTPTLPPAHLQVALNH